MKETVLMKPDEKLAGKSTTCIASTTFMIAYLCTHMHAKFSPKRQNGTHLNSKIGDNGEGCQMVTFTHSVSKVAGSFSTTIS